MSDFPCNRTHRPARWPLLVAAFVAALAAFSAASQTPAGPGGITDLAYSVQRGDSLYFTGKYQGKPVNLVRNGVIGSGKWTIYTGTPANRIRLILDDRKGLQEILAMDKGQRMTLNQVGEERIEYRLYAPDRSFIIGSVLYRKDKRWLLGTMKTEAFAGYPALTEVSDVTEKIGVHSALPSATFAGWLNNQWQKVNLISTATAQEDGLLGRFLGPQQIIDDLSGPAHVILKVMAVGAVAVTVKLAAVIVAGGETAAVGGALAAAAPFIGAVAVGIGVGLLARSGYDWMQARRQRGTTSLTEDYGRHVADTRYSNQPAPEPPQAMASQSNFSSRVEQADREDRQDKLAFRSALERAEQCTDNGCTNEALAEASRFARGTGDRRLVFAARERADVRVGLLLADEEIRKIQAKKEQDDRELRQAMQAGQEYMKALQEGIAQQQREQEAAAVFGSVLNQLGGAAAAAARRQPAATQRQPQANQPQVAPRAASTGNRAPQVIAQPLNQPIKRESRELKFCGPSNARVACGFK